MPIDYNECNKDEDCDDNNSGFIPLMYDTGLYFVCDIVVDRSRRYWIPYHKSFSEKALASAFKLSMEQIQEILSAGDLLYKCHNANLEHTINQSI